MNKNPLTSETKQAIEVALSVDDLVLTPLEGGTNDRTFFTRTEKGEFVVRLESGSGVQLRRAYGAQKRAEKLGVSVAKVIAHNFEENQEQHWIVEERVPGTAFYPDKMSEEEARATSFDLGLQLKKLHSVATDVYALLSPFPYETHKEWQEKNSIERQKELERNGPVYDSFSDHLDFKAKVIERAFEIAELDRSYIPVVKDVYGQLKTLYYGGPKFCEGDTATTNLVVQEGKVKALIDWEWAQGSDPAENVAYWHYWNKDPKFLDHFLEGYQPENEKAFRQRIDLYQITTAVHLINVLKEMGHDRWIKGSKEKLLSIFAKLK